jgi:uncharacterized protein (TIGR03083 family)
MTPVGHDRYCDEIITQTDALRNLLGAADLSVTVPTCPDWTLADLVRHIGGNLRSVETAVRNREHACVIDEQTPRAGEPDGDDPTLLDAWLAEVAERFAETLRKAGPDAEAQVWGFQKSTAFWARRATHDLVIHRADAAATVGSDYTVSPELAADAIDELLELVSDPKVADSSPRLAELRGPGKSIHLHATDTGPELAAEWLIELGADGFSWHRGHQKATVALRGPLADLLRVFYRRLPPSSHRVEVLGEAALLDLWLERVSLD